MAGLTAQFVAGFARMVKAGRVVAASAVDELAVFARAPELEALLKLFARVNTDSIWWSSPFTLDGRQMRQMLIQADVLEALAPDVPTRAPEYEALEQQLHAAPIDPLAREMFEEVIIGDDVLRLQASVALTRVAALDAWLTPVIMKRSRPGIVLTALCEPGRVTELSRVLFEESSTIGVRWTAYQRARLDREIVRLDTQYGPVAFKVSRLEGRVVTVTPEFEEVRRLARDRGVAVREVLEQTRIEGRRLLGSTP